MNCILKTLVLKLCRVRVNKFIALLGDSGSVVRRNDDGLIFGEPTLHYDLYFIGLHHFVFVYTYTFTPPI